MPQVMVLPTTRQQLTMPFYREVDVADSAHLAL